MKRNLIGIAAFSLLLSALAHSASAHHSMSGYDQSRSVTLQATITNFDWINPHVQIHFQVRGDNGTVSEWLAECPSPNRLSRAGWNEGMLKSGDQVTITGNPAKDGAKEMRLNTLALANGQEMRAYGARRGFF